MVTPGDWEMMLAAEQRRHDTAVTLADYVVEHASSNGVVVLPPMMLAAYRAAVTGLSS